MRVSRTRSLRVNMGNYGERYEFGASVTLDHADLGYDDEQWLAHVRDVGEEAAGEEILAVVMDQLGAALEGDLREALERKPAGEESFLDSPNEGATTRRKRSK